MALLNTPSSKSPIWTRDRVSSPSRSHFSSGLKLILQTQITNPEHGRLQSFSNQFQVINIITICIWKGVKTAKLKNHKYFKYANMTNEFTICDFLFNNNTFLTEITTRYSDRQYTQVTGHEYETLQSLIKGVYVYCKYIEKQVVDSSLYSAHYI